MLIVIISMHAIVETKELPLTFVRSTRASFMAIGIFENRYAI